jgi:hypothetical protein
MELRCSRCQAPSSIRRPTSGPRSNLCSGLCKRRSDPGCGLLDMPFPPVSGYLLVCTGYAIRKHTRALYSPKLVERVFSDVASVHVTAASCLWWKGKTHLTAGCVDTELPVGQCNYAHSDESVSETAWLHHAMWVDHSETCCQNNPSTRLGE